MLKWAGDETSFNYQFEARGLNPETDYSLIYYADGWPGNHPGALINEYTTSGSGNISDPGGSKDFGFDLPDPADANYPLGAKVWLVPSTYYDSGDNKINGWPASPDAPPSGWLFEYNLITYDDTDA